MDNEIELLAQNKSDDTSRESTCQREERQIR